MKIFKTKTNGFCFGVKRAVEKTFDLLKNSETPVYLIGELIHNEDITAQFLSLGAIITENISDIPDGSVCVIRAHGVPRFVEDELCRRNIVSYDLTCPKVKKIHEIASRSENLIIIGNSQHPEVIGIAGHAKGSYYIANNLLSLKQIIEEFGLKNKNTDLVFQTTFIVDEYVLIKEFVSSFSTINVHNTICNSTEIRQKEVEELSRKVDLFVILGSPKRSNTRTLFVIASQNCKAVFY